MALLAVERFVDQLDVDAQLLSRGGARQEREHQRQVVEGGHEALHAHQRDMGARQGGDHAPVAFVGDQADAARFGHAEVDAAQTHVGGEEDFAQHLARGVGQGGDVFGVRDAELLVEEFPHVAAAQMHGGGDDMAGTLSAQLHDVFAQVGLDGAMSRRFEGAVEVDLFRDHRFGFCDQR